MIPTNRTHIPTPDVANRWPNLQDMYNASKLPPLQDCEVGLLIGYNCPQALAPSNFITWEVGPHQPFAQETELGCSVVGRVSSSEEEDQDEYWCQPLSKAEVSEEIHYVLQNKGGDISPWSD